MLFKVFLFSSTAYTSIIKIPDQGQIAFNPLLLDVHLKVRHT